MRLHHALDVLDHDDGVVDHDADGKHDGEQGDRVGRVTDRLQDDEGADQAHRDGNGRNEGGAHTAEEQVDDDDDEDESLDQGLLNFLDGCRNGRRRVIGDLPGHVVRKVLRKLGDAGADVVQRLDRVCPRRLEDGHNGRGSAVESGVAIEICSTELETRHIAKAEHRSIRIRADDDVLEFGDGGETSLRLDVELQLLIVGDGARADAADRRLGVLRLDGAYDVADSQT